MPPHPRTRTLAPSHPAPSHQITIHYSLFTNVLMPELPEVEAVRRRLARVMPGRRITRVDLRRPDLRVPFGADFVARVEGQMVVRVTRRAKYLQVELASGDVILVHLGMSGSFRVLTRSAAATPGRFHHPRGALAVHDHVVFDLSSGVLLVFNDPRRFGSMRVLDGGTLASHPAIAGLGPEPLGRSFTANALAGALRGRRTSLKAALSDQRLVAGLGNIYVCEALHLARLSPMTPAGALVDARGEGRPGLRALHDGIRRALRTALHRRARYRGDDRFRVYGREGERCLRRGCPGTIRRIVQAGRSTYYCPACQR